MQVIASLEYILVILTSFGQVFDSVKSDCGLPPLPESTKIDSYRARYKERSFIRYECDDKSKELIGNNTLVCINGNWEGTAPLCAKEAKTKLESLMVMDLVNRKSVIRFLAHSGDDCWRPTFSWNVTNNQKWLINIKLTSQIDYFSLVLHENDDLLSYYLSKNLSINAKIYRPHKHCHIVKPDKPDAYQSRTRFGFVCETAEDNIGFRPEQYSNSFPLILTVHTFLEFPITVSFCKLKFYQLSDSCGAPEKPLHSFELLKEKSYTVFSCEEDFFIYPKSNQRVTCGHLGKWKSPFPRCLPNINCKLPAIDTDKDKYSDYLQVEYKDLNYINDTEYAEPNSLAIYSCKENDNNSLLLELRGENIRKCKHGFWSGVQPKCFPKTINNFSFILKPTDNSLANNKSNTGENFKGKMQSRLYIVVLSMFASFIIGAVIVGIIIYLIAKNLMKRRIQIPSLVISEHGYYEPTYCSQRYETIRLSGINYEFEQINPYYDSDNTLNENISK